MSSASSFNVRSTAAAAGLLGDSVIRENVGFSRYCETMANVISDWLAAEDLRNMMKPDIVTKVDTEANELLPHFQRLKSGKRACESFKQLAKRRRIDADQDAIGLRSASSTGPTVDSMDAVLAFLQKGKNSRLRSVINLLAGDGIFVAAQTFDKTAQAWLHHKELL
jgi:hypothetical protein